MADPSEHHYEEAAERRPPVPGAKVPRPVREALPPAATSADEAGTPLVTGPGVRPRPGPSRMGALARADYVEISRAELARRRAFQRGRQE